MGVGGGLALAIVAALIAAVIGGWRGSLDDAEPTAIAPGSGPIVDGPVETPVDGEVLPTPTEELVEPTEPEVEPSPVEAAPTATEAPPAPSPTVEPPPEPTVAEP